MTKLYTAAEARNDAHPVEEQFKHVDGFIRRAVTSGKTCTCIDLKLLRGIYLPGLYKSLNQRGFKVESICDPRDGDYLKVSW